nr:3709_t:CDS:2 [Entrophospora candida]
MEAELDLLIQDRKYKIIKQNQPIATQTPQTPIPSPINCHSNEDDSIDSVNLDQTQVQDSISPEVNSNNIFEQIVDISFDNAPNSEDKEINDFLDRKVKEKVGNMMRDINRKKKLLRTEAQSTVSSEIVEASTTVPDTKCNFPEIKIPYNQKVEQGLMRELSAEEFEKKVRDISSKNNINDQMARTQIYDEMEPYLPGVKREYLRKITQKAKNIYTLFNIKGIGIDKIEHITYSADAISTNSKYKSIEKISESTNARKRRKIHPEYTLFGNSSTKLDVIIELRSYNVEILEIPKCHDDLRPYWNQNRTEGYVGQFTRRITF